MAGKSESARLVVRRLSEDAFGVARSLRLLVDDREAARIAHGATQMVELSAGAHRVQVAMDWCRSEPRTIHVSPGGAVELLAHARHAPNLPLNLLGIIAWPRRFFVLRESDRSG